MVAWRWPRANLTRSALGARGASATLCSAPDVRKEGLRCSIRCSAFCFAHPRHSETPTMLYLGIDQHRKQLTVNRRDEQGTIILRRQVSTNWLKVRAFFAELHERAEAQGGLAAIVEVCG